MRKGNSSIRAKLNHDSGMLIILTVICIVFFSIMKPAFLSVDSFASIARQIPEIGLFTLSMMLPMLVGGIDLSIIASANLASILMSMYITSHIERGEENIPAMLIAIVICIGTCTAVGFLNGVIVAKFKIPAMLVTLGMQMVLTGISLGITKGGTLSGYPESFRFIRLQGLLF